MALSESNSARPETLATGSATKRHRIALLGNPNTGKTSVFNRLCGVRAKTANFPGTTTDARFGKAAFGDEIVDVIDLPGVYSLELDAPESRLASQALRGEAIYSRPDAAVVVVDATNLVRNLVFVSQVLATGVPTVVALNMVDLAQRRGLTVDAEAIARELGCPVVPLVARTGRGVRELRAAIAGVLGSTQPHCPTTPADAELWAEEIVAAAITGVGASDTFTERLDRAFTHPVLGLAVFVLIMAGLFWTLFSLATVPMDLIEATFEHLGAALEAGLPAGAIRELLVGGVVGGVAGTVVFLPQICLLFLLISLLEDTGYLARAAFVMDRLLCRFGLPGQAFVPLLSSHACAIPGIMATKLIPDRRDRLVTILVAPLFSCSARMPVYVLLTSLLFVDRPLLAGVAFAGCYVLGAAVALLSAFLFGRTLLPGRSKPMILELPSYKMPSLRNAVLSAAENGWAFLRTAGTIIMAMSIVMWWLSAYPKAPPSEESQLLRARATEEALAAHIDEANELLSQAEAIDRRNTQMTSFAGRLGRLVQPVFAPLGLDWQLTVGVLTSFVAREVFVSTMAVLVAGEETSDLSQGVIERIRSATRDDGSPLFSTAASAALLVFFVLAMQCLSTLVVTRRETGSWRWPLLQLAYMSALAWVLGFGVYELLTALGIR